MAHTDHATGGTGIAYSFTKAAVANLREKDDTYTSFAAGFAGGAVPGLFTRSLTKTIGSGAVLAVVMAAYQNTGGLLGMTKRWETDDVMTYKEELRKNRRRPIEQTIEELGEGRGIYGPGYQERRAQRIKERYGIDVPVGPQAAS